MKGFKILIAGGRDFIDFARVERDFIDLTSPYERKEITIISGMATGADNLGVEIANLHGVKLEEYPADWEDLAARPCVIRTNWGGKYNLLAGIARNQRMIDEGKPDLVLVYWDGKSKGSRDMINRTKKAGVKLIVESY